MPDISWCKKGGARGYVTTHPLEWWIGRKESGWLLTVPKGREFESSVPRLMQWFWSPDDPFFLKAACIHDMLLEEGFRPAFADSQWFEAALSEHAPPGRTVPAYLGMALRRFVRWSLGRAPRHILEVTGMQHDYPDPAQIDIMGLQVTVDDTLGHLMVAHDGTLTWDQLQAVKCLVWGNEARAIEVYPASADVVNNGQYRHLWRLGADDFCPDLLGHVKPRQTLERRFHKAWEVANA